MLESTEINSTHLPCLQESLKDKGNAILSCNFPRGGGGSGSDGGDDGRMDGGWMGGRRKGINSPRDRFRRPLEEFGPVNQFCFSSSSFRNIQVAFYKVDLSDQYSTPISRLLRQAGDTVGIFYARLTGVLNKI
uniref:Uncharacterized protein n=1 Tax=Vespula pensylvanica TaxID=30213 RepID=A0A834JT61_VESPE|nr:hypothetical protein H0235_016893 [Vespula pensylvanica]